MFFFSESAHGLFRNLYKRQFESRPENVDDSEIKWDLIGILALFLLLL